jgi:hypothetical protein
LKRGTVFFDQNKKQQQQQRDESKKKRKSRGNRKLQRFRAQHRKQGLNVETIGTLITEYNNPPHRHDDERGQEPALIKVNVQHFVELGNQVH